MAEPLAPLAAELARKRVFATVSTIEPDGRPQSQPVWVDTDGKHILVNTELDRRKERNARRDPRVTVLLVDPENPYRWVEVRGRVSSFETGPEARAHIDALAKRYMGVDDYPNPIQTERVILRIEPERQVVFDYS